MVRSFLEKFESKEPGTESFLMSWSCCGGLTGVFDSAPLSGPACLGAEVRGDFYEQTLLAKRGSFGND